jgi:hypothetical protein
MDPISSSRQGPGFHIRAYITTATKHQPADYITADDAMSRGIGTVTFQP